MPLAILAVWGSLCLVIALVQSWMIVARLGGEGKAIARIIPNARELIRSHIDYLMMALFLFAFYGLFRMMEIAPPVWLVALTCFGSFFNPFAFFVRAFKPAWIEAAPPPFMALITASCVATTIGYAACAWLIASAAISQAGG